MRPLEDFAYALKGKAVEFGHVLKIGRAAPGRMPMTLGQDSTASASR